MAEGEGPAQELCGQSATAPLDEAQVLSSEKIPRVQSDEI
jgi:hypothetical protein